MCAGEKCEFFLLLDGMFSTYLLSPFHLMCHLKSSIFLLILCQNDLSADESRILKSLPIIVLWSTSFLRPNNMCFIYLSAPHWVQKYLQLLYSFVEFNPLWLCSNLLYLLLCFILKSILSDILIAIPIFFSFPFLLAWNIFLIFSLSVSVWLF